MATIELPSPSSAAADGPTGLASPELGEVIKYGEGLGDEQYLLELQRIIGHDILITTISTQHISPLQHTARFPVPFNAGVIAFDQFPTTLEDIHRGEVLFPYEHPFERSGEISPRVVQAIAPIDRAITTIYLPV